MSILQWNVIRVLKSRTSVTWWGPWSTDFLLWQLSLRHHPDGCVQWRRDLRFIIQQPAKKTFQEMLSDEMICWFSSFQSFREPFFGIWHALGDFLLASLFFECRFLETDVLLQSTGVFPYLVLLQLSWALSMAAFKSGLPCMWSLLGGGEIYSKIHYI